jgi:hypothetical protein
VCTKNCIRCAHGIFPGPRAHHRRQQQGEKTTDKTSRVPPGASKPELKVSDQASYSSSRFLFKIKGDVA